MGTGLGWVGAVSVGAGVAGRGGGRCQQDGSGVAVAAVVAAAAVVVGNVAIDMADVVVIVVDAAAAGIVVGVHAAGVVLTIVRMGRASRLGERLCGSKGHLRAFANRGLQS